MAFHWHNDTHNGRRWITAIMLIEIMVRSKYMYEKYEILLARPHVEGANNLV